MVEPETKSKSYDQQGFLITSANAPPDGCKTAADTAAQEAAAVGSTAQSVADSGTASVAEVSPMPTLKTGTAARIEGSAVSGRVLLMIAAFFALLKFPGIEGR